MLIARDTGSRTDFPETTLPEAREALSYVSPDCPRDEWWRILAALKDGFGDSAKEAAREWSVQSDKFRPHDFERTWRSLKPGHITLATLFQHALDNGYKPELRQHHERPRSPTWKKPVPESAIPVIEASDPRPETWPSAQAIWQAIEREANKYCADDYVAAHPYPQSKWITWAAGAARFLVSRKGRTTDAIVVPLRSYPTHKLIGVEIIAPNSGKYTLGNKGLLVLGNDRDDQVAQYVVEGWATGVRTLLHYDFNCCVYVAGGKHAQDKVAEAVAYHTGRHVHIYREQDNAAA